MREILFRGKRVDNGEWVQGYIVPSRENTYPDGLEMITADGINYDELDGYMPDFISYAVDSETVGQYTGLTDKNGKPIFEGDIVKVEYTGANKGLDGMAKVVFEQCKFALEWGWHKEIVCLTDFCNVTFDVIGNVHDNPELIGGEAK